MTASPRGKLWALRARYLFDNLKNEGCRCIPRFLSIFLLRKIKAAGKDLEQFPYSGTPLEVSGIHILYRYVICGSYMIFYHISEETVWVDRILYGRRDYLAILFGSELSEE